ncbi:hypothetical protein BDB00DRAFT_477237 [Zychaea mexicana]|uniref:uncharacterized protein n=1 Tax=Zychaea mexicana TaxID=64656 RepID=UPI0022FE60AB|nr:uncharacterized protein BDB00DRAFT_477237 [Zychaea mexicana]KAI9491695.1 hypothetical protein BDB00DRAFT_477237 [Zychaea mexicana]
MPRCMVSVFPPSVYFLFLSACPTDIITNLDTLLHHRQMAHLLAILHRNTAAMGYIVLLLNNMQIDTKKK